LGFKIQPARSRTRHWGRHAQDVLGIQQEHQLVDVNGEPLLRRGTCLDAWLVSAVKGGLGCENLVESIQKKKHLLSPSPFFGGETSQLCEINISDISL